VRGWNHLRCTEAAVYLLEDVAESWVVNARDAKNVPGRPKTTGWTRSGCVELAPARGTVSRSRG
jgi:hypothetical protein